MALLRRSVHLSLSHYPKSCNQCCAAGISEIDVPTSLDLVRRVAVGLHNSAVDDTHLSARWGDLLQNLASRLRSRLAEPTTPKSQSLAMLSKDHAGTSVAHETQTSIIHYSSQDLQTRPDAEPDTQFDAWSMWWDDQFSQVNLNYMPWFPTLGLVSGSDPSFSNDATDGIL